MVAHNVVLTDRQHKMIDSLVSSGRYQNASEVLREGLRLVERREAEDAARLEALREAARAGWNDLEAGRFRDVPADGLADYIGRVLHDAMELERHLGDVAAWD
jgi:antitoxin ParD1/3/4